MPRLPFLPTHVITFRPMEGDEFVFPVQLEPSETGYGPAQSWEEYRSGFPASWQLTPDGWLFEGSPTPGGRCGSITVHDQSALMLVCFRFLDFEEGSCVATVHPHEGATLDAWLAAAKAADYFCLARSRSDARTQLLEIAYDMFPTPQNRPYHAIAIRWESPGCGRFEINLLSGDYCGDSAWPGRRRTVAFCGDRDQLPRARELRARIRGAVSLAFTTEIYDTQHDYKLF